MLTAPALSSWQAGRHISGSTGTLALGLTPVVAAVAVSAYAVKGDIAGLLWPGLAGIAGLLLLLPQPDLASVRRDLALAMMPTLAGVGATVVGHRIALSKELATPFRQRAVWIGQITALAAAILLVVQLATGGDREVSGSFFIGAAADGILSALTLVVLFRLGTMRWTSQLLLVPLVTILEGILLLHPAVTARSWVGLALLGLGSAYLLAERSED